MSVDKCVLTRDPYLRFRTDSTECISGNFSSKPPSAPNPTEYGPIAADLGADDLVNLPNYDLEERVQKRDLNKPSS